MMREFDKLAHENYADLAPGVAEKDAPGKSIIFAITKNHATRLAKILNDLHPEDKGNYAAVITSDVADTDGIIRAFKRDTNPKVAVSVGMLDTGFDCREVLHIVMSRRVRSPILYQQMRGRGTRTAPHIGKRKFVIYDFFKNHDHSAIPTTIPSPEPASAVEENLRVLVAKDANSLSSTSTTPGGNASPTSKSDLMPSAWRKTNTSPAGSKPSPKQTSTPTPSSAK